MFGGINILKDYKYKNGEADLHNHTTASDGLLTSTEMVRYAKLKNVKCLAITDHDTTNGVDEAIEASREYNIQIIPGIELNTDYKGSEIHLLGYFINYKLDWFQDLLAKIRDARRYRAEKMIINLKEIYGLDITYDEVAYEAKGAAIARPHIARVLLRKGLAASMAEVFGKYLNPDNPAYVARYKLTYKEGVELILKAEGVPCLAHPALINNQSYIVELIELGTKGLEVFHSKHTPLQTEQLKKIASKFNLIVTGGSDCHGELTDGMPILGDVTVNLDSVKQLKKVANKLNMKY